MFIAVDAVEYYFLMHAAFFPLICQNKNLLFKGGMFFFFEEDWNKTQHWYWFTYTYKKHISFKHAPKCSSNCPTSDWVTVKQTRKSSQANV